ncbi:hypothetical protein HMPREF9103_01363 [Lentilactobacillus parafarraginis F0439]|uniref:Uncharacterized protein n=1 Tax=Lentilactobacillus parafarraginis F0439 TaxID=797515 RepID=G9ZNQ9_9LACO|nr:hypothetical protein HMPREF9103_01363 [Lentilactobacillus parafarraginis F0439]
MLNSVPVISLASKYARDDNTVPSASCWATCKPLVIHRPE